MSPKTFIVVVPQCAGLVLPLCSAMNGEDFDQSVPAAALLGSVSVTDVTHLDTPMVASAHSRTAKLFKKPNILLAG